MTCIDMLLSKIRTNPYIYIGEMSLVKLKSFIDGYIVCEIEFNEMKSIEEFNGFQAFIENKFCVEGTDSWCTLILSRYDDPVKAFNAFFEFLDEYIEQMKENSRTGN